MDERRPTGNHFIDALPASVAVALTREADLRVYAEDAEIAASGDRIRCIIFPISGAIALVEHAREGGSAEVAVIGSEGFWGCEALLGVPHAQFAAVTSVPTSAFELDAAHVRALFVASPQARALVERYAAAMMRVAGIAVACERHHRVEARLANYLLQLHDHAGNAPLRVTHDLVASRLGMRRAGVTEAYADLTRIGAMSYERARLTLLDPALLELLACGCSREAKDVLLAVYGDAEA